MFSKAIIDAFRDSDTGFPIRNRSDGNLFNLRRLQAKTKVDTDELHYADGINKKKKQLID